MGDAHYQLELFFSPWCRVHYHMPQVNQENGTIENTKYCRNSSGRLEHDDAHYYASMSE